MVFDLHSGRRMTPEEAEILYESSKSDLIYKITQLEEHLDDMTALAILRTKELKEATSACILAKEYVTKMNEAYRIMLEKYNNLYEATRYIG
jgi:uncharacterized SAM-dependent methyltransferase